MAGIGLLIFAGKSTENVLPKYLTKHMAYVFNKFHICFVLSVQREDHVAILEFQKWGLLWGQSKCPSCMGIFYVNRKNLNVNSRHNWEASQWSTQTSLRIATVVTRLPRL